MERKNKEKIVYLCKDMLIVLILVLLLVWSAVIWSIYSNFLVFYSNFRETEDYHKAYYASISALERWELVTRQHEPWYVGSGGFKMWIWTWSVNNTTWWSDGSLSGFSYFWTNSGESTVFWTVNSRTKRIPAIWEWDVEEMFVTWDVKNYNMMDYENAEVFLLYYDDSKRPYTWKDIMETFESPDDFLTWIIRLPQAITEEFWDLDTAHALLGEGEALPKNDAIVDWQNKKPELNEEDKQILSFAIISLIKLISISLEGINVWDLHNSTGLKLACAAPLAKYWQRFWNWFDCIII